MLMNDYHSSIFISGLSLQPPYSDVFDEHQTSSTTLVVTSNSNQTIVAYHNPAYWNHQYKKQRK